LDRLAVDGRREVDGHEVTGLRGPLDGLQRREPLAQVAQLFVEPLVADITGVDRDLESLVARQLELRTYVDLCGERELVAVGEVRYLDLGVAEDVEVVLPDGFAVEPRQRLVDRLFEHGGTTDV